MVRLRTEGCRIEDCRIGGLACLGDWLGWRTEDWRIEIRWDLRIQDWRMGD